MMFASKTPSEPRREYMECAHGDYPQDDGLDYCMCRAVWIEHPHVQHNEPNPILVEFRATGESQGARIWREALDRPWLYPAYGEDLANPWTLAQIEHARKVLTRLARLDTEALSH